MQAEVVICGAGIAGVAAAEALLTAGVRDVVVVDERPLLSLTSDKSSECYRNWWPDAAMLQLMNRSFDLLEKLADESDNYFHLNRRGYVYVTAVPETVAQMAQSAQTIAALGAGELRQHSYSRDPKSAAGFSATLANGDDPRHTAYGMRHTDPPTYQPAPAHGYQNQPDGADLLLGADLIRRHFPFVTPEAVAALHVRRAGWLSAQQFGMYLWERAKGGGARLVNGRLSEVRVENGRVHSVRVQTGDGPLTLQTNHFVNAAGPYLHQVGQMVGVELPVYNELHGKIALEDPLGLIPRDAPLMIWQDRVRLPWSDEEREYLAESEATRWLLDELPPGAHFRPEGGSGSQTLILLWPYHQVIHPSARFPHRFDREYPEIVLRGLTRLAPRLGDYVARMSKPIVDGGYYTRTRENRPLIGPLPVTGAYVMGALSGYGIMAALAAGELLAAHLTGAPLPAYAPAFQLDRYADPAYQAMLANWGEEEEGQL
jgi:sarcosine oxidase, subunit beta